MKFILVHGFLGSPKDFEFLIQQSKQKYPNLKIETINLWTDSELNPTLSISDWAKAFNKRYQQEQIIALGYSLGGRLLAHAFYQEPHLFKKLFLVSANPFKLKSEEQKLRKKQNHEWADKILNWPWSDFYKEWNSQTIFKSQKSPQIRHDFEFNKTLLAEALMHWGPDQQDLPFDAFLKIPQNNIFWISGELDLKYTSIYEDLKPIYPNHHFKVFQNSGHRVPWEADKFNAYILENLKPE